MCGAWKSALTSASYDVVGKLRSVSSTSAASRGDPVLGEAPDDVSQRCAPRTAGRGRSRSQRARSYVAGRVRAAPASIPAVPRDVPDPCGTVIGTGYLGATHAAAWPSLGYDVLGVDVDGQGRRALRGRTPFYEPGLEALLRKHVVGGRLRFTTSIAEARSSATSTSCASARRSGGQRWRPTCPTWTPRSTALPPHADRPRLVVGKSTVPVGTRTTRGAALAAPRGRSAVELAWNPEFLREGYAVEDTLQPTGSSSGPSSDREQRPARGLRAADRRGPPVVVSDLATAELVKASANAFLATKISFINAMAEVCEATGADVTQLAEGAGLRRADRRRQFLNAGLGFGGGCLPKDIRAFMARAGELGADQALTFLREVDAINMRRRPRRRRPGPSSWRRVVPRHARRRARCCLQARVRRHPRLARAQRRRADPAAGRTGHRLRPQGDGQRPFAVSHHSTTGRVRSTRRRAPTSCCTSPSGASSGRWTRRLGDVVGDRRIVDGRKLDPARWRAAGYLPRAGTAENPPTADLRVIQRLLRDCHTWAVVGWATTRRGRPIAWRLLFLKERGKRIVPVHLSGATVHGEPGFTLDLEIPFQVDVVDVFRRLSEAGAGLRVLTGEGGGSSSASSTWTRSDAPPRRASTW